MKNNKYKSIIKSLTYIAGILIATFATSMAFASDTGATFNPFNVPSTDQSIAFLGQIFGNIPGALPSGVQTIMGRIFYYFNSSMLILAGIILTYGTFKFIIELSHHHDQMQRKYSYWQPLRVVIGFGLLVPLPTGYSALNSIIMWTIIQGVGLADTVWTQAVDYMNHSGILTTGTTAQQTAQNLLYPELLAHNDDGTGGINGSSDILRSLVCMYSMQYALEDQRVNHYNKDHTDSPDNNQVLLTPSFEQKDSTSTGTIFFPGSFTDTTLLAYVNTSSSSLGDPKGHCGQYIWTNVPSTVTLSDTQGPINYQNAKKVGAMQMIVELDALAQLIAQTSNNTADPSDVLDPALLDDTDFQNQVMTAMVSAAADYQANIYPSLVYASQDYVPHTSSENPSFQQLEVNTSSGWVSAGRYYYELIRVHNLNTNVNNTSSSTYDINNLKGGINESAFPPPYYAVGGSLTDPATTNVYPYFGNDSSRITNMTATITWLTDPEEKAAATLLQSLNDTNKAATTAAALPTTLQQMIKDNTFAISLPTVSGSAGTNIAAEIATGVYSMGTKVVLAPVNKAIQNVITNWNSIFMEQNLSGFSPFLAIQAFGNKLITEGLGIWTNIFNKLNIILGEYFLVTTVPITIANIVAACIDEFAGIGLGVNQLMIQLQQASGQILDMFVKLPIFLLLPIAVVVSSMMIVMGITYAYYVPLVPFMLFLFGTITWLITVIEAMAAAPIIALAISHPEGTHDVLGKAEHAVGLIFSVFLRPVCLVMGLIASIILTYVALNVLNTTFGGVINSLFYTNPNLTNAVGNPTNTINQITGGSMIIIYLLIVMALYNQCNSLIYQLVNKVLQYINIQAPSGEEARLVGEVKQGFESQTKGMTEALTGTLKGVSLGKQTKAFSGAKAKKTDEIKGEPTSGDGSGGDISTGK